MNRTETLALLASGRDSWNDWARRTHENRVNLSQLGEMFNARDRHQNALADFSTTDAPHIYDEYLDLSGFLFPGPVNFSGAQLNQGGNFSDSFFKGQTNFNNSIFFGNLNFSSAQFEQSVNFQQSIFATYSLFFASVKFDSDANFFQCDFLERATPDSHCVNFTGSTFSTLANFSEARFDQLAFFCRVNFRGHCTFDRLKNSEPIYFDGSIFSDNAFFIFSEFTKLSAPLTEFAKIADFNNVSIASDCDFTRSRFSGQANFAESKHIGPSQFSSAVFERGVDFQGARFDKLCKFQAASSNGVFLLTNASFHVVPDFTQATFADPPSLDRTFIPAPPKNLRRLPPTLLSDVYTSADLVSRYRALRRIARASLDHERELEFFAYELEAARALHDMAYPRPQNLFRKHYTGPNTSSSNWIWRKPEHYTRADSLPVWAGAARFWFGLLYSGFSDYGRSLARPIIFLFLSWALFSFAYFEIHPTVRSNFIGSRATADSTMSQPSALTLSLLSVATSESKCISGSGDRIEASMLLSLRRTLIFFTVDRSETANKLYMCLYGVIQGADESGINMKPDSDPNLPVSVSLLGYLQAIFSTAFIFLFGLAARNTFRL